MGDAGGEEHDQAGEGTEYGECETGGLLRAGLLHFGGLHP